VPGVETDTIAVAVPSRVHQRQRRLWTPVGQGPAAGIGDARLGETLPVEGGDDVLVDVDPARCDGHEAASWASRSSATSVIMSSWPPTMPRRPTSTRRLRASMPYRAAAASAWRRKLE
jgi:hypothetical protein